ncbi:pilus assembly FimT family protein [Desulfobacter sp.]|uniref:pilus assembly FimT family protein n=1 Tax=Desulfobacter sp. TaxID=2294 RepID=UPI003D0AB332
MRISPTGKIRNNHSGFTFVELMVVVGIFTIILLFSIPLFRQIHLTSNASDHVSGLILFLENLKLKAMKENKTFTLYMDSGSGKMYVTDDTMDEDACQAARNNGLSLDSDLQLINLEFPDDAGRASDDKRICFFSKGYSDRVLIHVREQRQEMTIQICMFQKKIHLIDKYVSYDDCI